MFTNTLLPSLFYYNHTADDEMMAGPGSVEFCTHKHDERLDRSGGMRYPKTSWEHIRCKWHFGADYAHIKSDSLILDSTILGRLENRGLFTKIPGHDGEDVFHKLCK
jgi:hypothetical protein